MKTYACITDLIAQEIAPVLATDDTLTPEQGDRIASEVCTRLQAAGLVVWEDGWDESRGAYWLPAQGFRMVADEDDDGAAFWAIVSDVLSDDDAAVATTTTTCPSWCTIDHEGPDDEGLHRADVERTDGFTVTVYRTDPADYQVHVDTNSFRGLTVEEALGLADALVRAAAFVQTGGAPRSRSCRR